MMGALWMEEREESCVQRGVVSSVRYPWKGGDSARDFPRFPGSSPHCYQSELLGFVTGNRSFLKFVLALLYSLQTASVPKHVCFIRNGGAAALSPHPAVAGDSRALE